MRLTSLLLLLTYFSVSSSEQRSDCVESCSHLDTSQEFGDCLNKCSRRPRKDSLTDGNCEFSTKKIFCWILNCWIGFKKKTETFKFLISRKSEMFQFLKNFQKNWNFQISIFKIVFWKVRKFENSKKNQNFNYSSFLENLKVKKIETEISGFIKFEKIWKNLKFLFF